METIIQIAVLAIAAVVLLLIVAKLILSRRQPQEDIAAGGDSTPQAPAAQALQLAQSTDEGIAAAIAAAIAVIWQQPGGFIVRRIRRV